MTYLVLDNFLIFLVKSFFLIFFLTLLSFFDVKKGKIPNKILIIMLVVGILLNLIVSRDFFFDVIKTSILFFLFSFVLWELALINAGDVKLLGVIPLYFTYSFSVSFPTLFLAFLSFVFFFYTFFMLFFKLIRKQLKIKEIFVTFAFSLRSINYFQFFLVVFSLFTFFYFLNFDFFLSFLLLFFVVVLLNNLKEVKSIFYFIFFVISFLLFLTNGFYKNLNFWKQLIFLSLIILFFRHFFFILVYFSSLKYKKIEELRIGDKLAEVPLKIGNSFAIFKITPLDLYFFYKIKESAIDNYDPSLGLEEHNIYKLKKFFKQNHKNKVGVFEEIPFVPFLLLTYLLLFIVLSFRL